MPQRDRKGLFSTSDISVQIGFLEFQPWRLSIGAPVWPWPSVGDVDVRYAKCKNIAPLGHLQDMHYRRVHDYAQAVYVTWNASQISNLISYKQLHFVASAKNETSIIKTCFRRTWTFQGWFLPWKNADGVHTKVSSGTAKLGPGKVISIHFKILGGMDGPRQTSGKIELLWSKRFPNDSKPEHKHTIWANASH